jgi:WD40 repeat protein
VRKPIGAPLQGHEDSGRSVAFSPDGARIVSGSYDNTLRLWQIESSEVLSVLELDSGVLTVAGMMTMLPLENQGGSAVRRQPLDQVRLQRDNSTLSAFSLSGWQIDMFPPEIDILRFLPDEARQTCRR